MLFSILFASVVAANPTVRSGGFPIAYITTDAATINAVNSTPVGSARDVAATNKLLLPAMQQLFSNPAYAITAAPGDITMKKTFPDQQIDNDCSHKIKAESPTASFDIKNSSTLKFGIANISWKGATVFADAHVQSMLDVSTNVNVKTGAKVFGHCEEVASKTVGVDVKSDGDTGVGMNITAYDARIERVNGTWSLVFNLHASVIGTILKWNVEQVTANNCKIKILGITIISVCGLIEKYVKEGASILTNEVMTVQAPKLLQKLEDKINTLIGSEVIIPLKW
eukprot:m.23574 g.23574  ORF g.23574 m.23574 type:complete len:282 (-) comp14268_c1_seq1:208-1053(-)